jgi:hypothetical protein
MNILEVPPLLRFGAAALLLLMGRGAVAEDGATDAAKEPATLREMIDAAIERCQVFSDAQSTRPAEARVVLRWANNARGSEDGTTILYIHEGRPLAAGCLYPWDGRLIHDFEAISGQGVVARRDGNVVWQPRESGVKFADIPDAPSPESTRAQRLRQMKSLAGQFQSTMLGWKADDTDREELRLLPRPLYRYEPRDESLIDGAVFAFVMGTDPESLLLIEAVHDNDTSRWQYAFARRTSGELEGRYREQVVWRVARYPTENDPAKPHFATGVPIPPQLLIQADVFKEAKTP